VTQPAQAQGPFAIDWNHVQQEVTQHLVNLIRIDTSNPPGNEALAAEYLRDVLAGEGIESITAEMAPGRANLVAPLGGTGNAGPLLLFGHLDVVPADPSNWEHDPFSGAVVDGYIWGRGAVDMKHIVAATLTAFLLAHRLRVPLRRDLIFAATADEESAGESGAGWLFRTHPNLVQCETALTEGPSVFKYKDSSYFILELAQRGWLTVDLIRRSPSGHSSIPSSDNCLIEIGRVLDRLGRQRFTHDATRFARSFLEQLSEDQEEPDRSALLALLDPAKFEVALEQLTCDAQTKGHLEALLHSQATPTMVSGGESTWAIPEQATVRLAGRVLPGQSEADWLAQLERIIGPLGEHTLSDFDPGVEASENTSLFEDLETIIQRHNPGARVLAALSPAGGDARHPLLAGADSLGFFPLTPEPSVPDGMRLRPRPERTDQLREPSPLRPLRVGPHLPEERFTSRRADPLFTPGVSVQRVGIVRGAARGSGSATSSLVANPGFDLLITDRRSATAAESQDSTRMSAAIPLIGTD
jgi:acetylornithine deacetylase/succinyl-diaminopimelate desuccinylase-like protein